MSGYDLVVIGAGASGLAAARSAHRAGHKVALVEAERPGGDCTFYGCIPSKALLESARRVAGARSGGAYGFHADPTVDFRRVMERVAAAVEAVAHDESPQQLLSEGIELVTGRAFFSGPDEVEVGGRRLSARRFVVATGSRSEVPPIEGIESVSYLDNRTVFDLRELPDHLLVLGGGPMGLELGQAMRRLGARVTLVEAAPLVLGKEEPEAQQAITSVLRREGLAVLTGRTVVRVSPGPVLHLDDGGQVAGSHLLLAAGRQPATDGLRLDAAGVVLERGRVVTDEHLRAAPTVWAAGDCTSGLPFTHVGDEQGRLATHNAFAGRLRRKAWDDAAIPWVTFTDPEVGRVGLSEAQAAQRFGDRARVAEFPAAHGDRARAAGETEGFVKLVAVRPRIGPDALAKLVGMTVVGPVAGEQVALGALAIRTGMLVGRLAQTVVAYPTWNLSVRQAAARFFGEYGGQGDRAAVGPAAT